MSGKCLRRLSILAGVKLQSRKGPYASRIGKDYSFQIGNRDGIKTIKAENFK